MKKMLILILIPLIISGCAKKSETSPANAAELDNFIPKEEIIYDGLLGFSHKISPISGKEGFTYKGVLEDGVAEPVNYKLSYMIDENGLKEMVYADGGENLYFTSIIKDKIILPYSLEVGSSWKEYFTYNGTSHESLSTITKIELLESGKKIFTTKTVVYGIKSFPNNRYEEVRIFEEGFGLVYFEKSLELTKDAEGNEVDLGFNFHYAARNRTF